MLAANPMAMAEALLAVDFLAGPLREIIIARSANDPGSLQPFQQGLRDAFCPRKVLFVGEPGSPEWQRLAESIPLLRDKVARDGRVTAYVCTRGRCELPTADPQQFLSQIVG
jgi:hypothetical protein